MEIIPREFYEFHRYRAVSRAGQPILTKTSVEIGPMISREDAFWQARNGKDVYTFLKRDAERLAEALYPEDPAYDPPHKPNHFQHFHPGGEHPLLDEDQEGRPRAREGPGHVFFGFRGENYSKAR